MTEDIKTMLLAVWTFVGGMLCLWPFYMADLTWQQNVAVGCLVVLFMMNASRADRFFAKPVGDRTELRP